MTHNLFYRENQPSESKSRPKARAKTANAKPKTHQTTAARDRARRLLLRLGLLHLLRSRLRALLHGLSLRRRGDFLATVFWSRFLSCGSTRDWGGSSASRVVGLRTNSSRLTHKESRLPPTLPRKISPELPNSLTRKQGGVSRGVGATLEEAQTAKCKSTVHACAWAGRRGEAGRATVAAGDRRWLASSTTNVTRHTAHVTSRTACTPD